MVLKTSPYIYQVLANEISPYEYNETVERKEYGSAVETIRVGKYHYYSYFYNKGDFLDNNLTKEDSLIIVSEEFIDIVEFFRKKNYKEYKYKSLYIFMNENLKIELPV